MVSCIGASDGRRCLGRRRRGFASHGFALTIIAGLTGSASIADPVDVGELGAGELHVWTLALDVPAGTLAAARGLLTREERARFARIEPAGARAERCVARAGLRLLLGSYLGVDPGEVRLEQSPGGRPELAAAHGAGTDRAHGTGTERAHALGFNLSHTGGLAIFAIGRGRSIGVDIEALDRREPSVGLLERALDSGEVARVMRARAHGRTGAFLGYWTVKEAYAKALGVGLALDLRKVRVEGRADRPRLDLPAGAGAWRVRRVWPRPDVVGAVVADGEPWRMRLRELSLG